MTNEQSQRLDALILQVSDLVDHLMDLRDTLIQHMKTGCFNIAQARLGTAMGWVTLSSAQYPEDMTALSVTEVEDATTGKLSLRKQSGKDPLKWFGVLVPKTLKDAQKGFTEALPIVLEIAAVQSHIQALTEEYEEVRAALPHTPSPHTPQQPQPPHEAVVQPASTS
eukprot:EC715918.1.p1 GENE.EC715918.1~~EC715918.1.p1  ORF type:complete len:167 (+),score=14.93 EC715918.1:85-585(+)